MAATPTYDALYAAQGWSTSSRLQLAAVPRGARVLDVGCAGGYFAEALRRDRDCDVVGVEFDLAAAAIARDRGFEVVVGSVDDGAVRARLSALAGDGGSGFDAVVCGDVLEHLADPWDTFAFLAELARPGGRVIVSVPNVAHWTGRVALVRGRWPRAEFGLFDRTHLRWFTRSDARELVEAAGLRIVEEGFGETRLPSEERLRLPPRARVAAARRWPELFALQFVLVAERPGA